MIKPVESLSEFIKVTDKNRREKTVPFLERDEFLLLFEESNPTKLSEARKGINAPPDSVHVIPNVKLTPDFIRNLLAFAVYGWQRPTDPEEVGKLVEAMKQGKFDPYTGSGIDIYVLGNQVVLAGYRHRSFGIAYSNIEQPATMNIRVFKEEGEMREAYALSHEQKPLATSERRRLNLRLSWSPPEAFRPKMESSCTAIAELGLDAMVAWPKDNVKRDAEFFYGKMIPYYEEAYRLIWQGILRHCTSKTIKDNMYHRGRMAMFVLGMQYDPETTKRFLTDTLTEGGISGVSGRPEYFLRRLLLQEHLIPKHPDIPSGLGYGTGGGSAKRMAEEISILYWHYVNGVRVRTGKNVLPNLSWPDSMLDFNGTIFVPGIPSSPPAKQVKIELSETLKSSIAKGVRGINRLGRIAGRSLAHDDIIDQAIRDNEN